MKEERENAINEKLIKLEEYLRELKDYKPKNFQQYAANRKNKYAVE